MKDRKTTGAEKELAELKGLIKELIDMLDWTEVSDNGTEFHPTHFSSCRVMHCERFGKIFPRLKKLVREGEWTGARTRAIGEIRAWLDGEGSLLMHDLRQGLLDKLAKMEREP